MNLVQAIKQRLKGELGCKTVVIEGRTFLLAKEVQLVFKHPDSATISFYNDDGKLLYSQPLAFMSWKDLYENTLTINLSDTWVLLEVKYD